MSHIHNNQYPFHAWKQDFPNVSFPTPRDGLNFAEQGIWWVQPTQQPEHDPATEMVVEGFPERLADVTVEYEREITAQGPEDPEEDGETPEPVFETVTEIHEQWRQAWEVVPREPEPEYVPEEVEGWQAEVAMRATLVDPEDVGSQNVWDRVQDLISLMPEGLEKIAAQTVLKRGKIRRDSPMLAQLAPLVPLTGDQVDILFRLAYSIEA